MHTNIIGNYKQLFNKSFNIILYIFWYSHSFYI